MAGWEIRRADLARVEKIIRSCRLPNRLNNEFTVNKAIHHRVGSRVFDQGGDAACSKAWGIGEFWLQFYPAPGRAEACRLEAYLIMCMIRSMLGRFVSAFFAMPMLRRLGFIAQTLDLDYPLLSFHTTLSCLKLCPSLKIAEATMNRLRLGAVHTPPMLISENFRHNDYKATLSMRANK